MKIKTSELTGAALDWAVTSIDRPEMLNWPDNPANRPESYTFRPSTGWAHGGPIIEREFITLEGDYNEWRAKLFDDGRVYEQEGPTPLIAAMRCFVASKLGDEVDVPEELLG